MAKYDLKFKRMVVKDYLQNENSGGYRAVADRHFLAHSVVRHWVALYQQHGTDGLVRRRWREVAFTPQFKLEVLQYMWSEGLSPSQTTAHFGLRSKSAVSKWTRQYHENGADAFTVKTLGRPPTMPVAKPEPPPPISMNNPSQSELLAEVEHLRAEVAYLKKQQALVRAMKKTVRA
jgi:transposase